MSNDNKLLMVVHSNSLNEAIRNDKRVVDVLLECAKMRKCLVLATPADASALSMFNSNVARITYEDRGERAFVATYKIGTYESKHLFQDSIPQAMITDLCGCKEDSTEFKEIKGAFHDLLAFEAISRWHKDESIFVTQYPNLLEKNVWLQKNLM